MHGERIQQQDELIPHSCEHCKIIEIDGTKTGAYVNQVFEYSYSDVQTYSQNCELFKWALNLPYWDKNGPAHLALSISTDTEDLQTLDAEWHNCRRREETDDIDKASLHIFAKKGILK
jgi:hypothetical protein